MIWYALAGGYFGGFSLIALLAIFFRNPASEEPDFAGEEE